MIFDTAGCGRRQGSALRSDERAEEREPLTAVLASQIINLSGAKERKKNSARDEQQSGTVLTQNPEHYLRLIGKPFTLNFSKARRELGYANPV